MKEVSNAAETIQPYKWDFNQELKLYQQARERNLTIEDHKKQLPTDVGPHWYIIHMHRIRLFAYSHITGFTSGSVDLSHLFGDLEAAYGISKSSTEDSKNKLKSSYAATTKAFVELIGEDNDDTDTKKRRTEADAIALHGSTVHETLKKLMENMEQDVRNKKNELFWCMEAGFLKDGFFPTEKLSSFSIHSQVIYTICSCFLYYDKHIVLDEFFGCNLIDPRRPSHVLKQFASSCGGGDPMTPWNGYNSYLNSEKKMPSDLVSHMLSASISATTS